MHQEFDLSDDIIHLNHAAVGPWPRRAVTAVQRFADENARLGSLHYGEWLATQTRLRRHLAALIGAEAPSDIALAKSTSEALSMIAGGLDWQPGDNVVGIAQEFPSNRIAWEALAERGVEWRTLDLDAAADPETELMALCDRRTRLVAVSWVQYARGLRLDLPRLAGACREHGALLCVDGIQGLGALPFDLAEMPVDFVVADGHKWLLGPEGLALFWCRPALRAHLKLTQFGWNMVAEPGDFERRDWQPAADARRFECGSPNLLGTYALEASVGLLLEEGMAAVAAALEARTTRLIELIDGQGWALLSPRATARRAGIVTFRVPDRDQGALYRALLAKGLLCAQRGGGIRFSPHFYTPMEQLERAIKLTGEAAAALG
jgi:selenocysteine lyase/cysteine desulfurase